MLEKCNSCIWLMSYPASKLYPEGKTFCVVRTMPIEKVKRCVNHYLNQKDYEKTQTLRFSPPSPLLAVCRERCCPHNDRGYCIKPTPTQLNYET